MKSGGQLKLYGKVSQKLQKLGFLQETFLRFDLRVFLKFWILKALRKGWISLTAAGCISWTVGLSAVV